MRASRGMAGHSLLELLAATAVSALAIVPALEAMRDGMELSRKVEDHNLVLTLAVGKLEEHLAIAAAEWTEATASGDFAADGYANTYYSVTRSEQTAGGGIPDRLMSVSSTVWVDTNGNASPDSGEIQASFQSKIAKLTTYEDAAGGS